jgi:hypothetical protein
MGADSYFYSVPFDALCERWAREHKSTVQDLQALCEELGVRCEEPLLHWSWVLTDANELNDVLHEHGLDIYLPNNPDNKDDPFKVESNGPAFQFFTPSHVASLLEQFHKSVARPIEEMEAFYRRCVEAWGAERCRGLELPMRVARYLPRVDPMLHLFLMSKDFVESLEPGPAPPDSEWAIDDVVRTATDERDRYDRSLGIKRERGDPLRYEPVTFDWKSYLMVEAVERVLTLVVSRGDGLVVLHG